MRLLIIEDNDKLASLMKKLLGEAGHVVDTFAEGGTAAAALATVDYDLVILDLSLPDTDGLDVLRLLRRAGHDVPVLVATARADLGQRVQTLNDGADDYLIKPFSLDELLARVRALLRRPRLIAQSHLVAGNVSLDTVSQLLHIGRYPVELARRELAVLAALLGQKGKLVDRRKLEDAVYSFDTDVMPNAIEAAVSRLRRRLESHGATVSITAMRGLGYILTERPSC